MGTLRTLAFTILNDERTCVEVVVPLENVQYAMSFTERNSGDRTSLLSFKQYDPEMEGETLHVDLHIEQMEVILHKNGINPSKIFRTHGLTGIKRKKAKKS